MTDTTSTEKEQAAQGDVVSNGEVEPAAATEQKPAQRTPRISEAWRRRLLTLPEFLVALGASVAYAITFGFNYGVDNQVVYMLGALKIRDPSLFQNDWFATQTTHYHAVFEYITAALLSVGKEGWSIAVAQVVVITLVGMSLYWLLRVLAGRRDGLGAFIVLMAFSCATQMRSVGVSYAVDYIFQPSTLGSLGFIAAIPAFISGRWWLSGALLAAGGLFHANYLILGAIVLGLGHLMLGRREIVGRLVRQFTLPTLALLIFVPTILKTAGSGAETLAARDILFNMRSPHHFKPSSYEGYFMPFIAWQMVGLGAGFGLRWLNGTSEKSKRIGAIVAGLLIVIWTGTAAATGLQSGTAQQLFVQRLAPHTELLMLAMASVALVRIATDPGTARRFSFASAAVSLAGVCILVMFEGNRKREELPRLFYIVLAAVLGVCLVCLAYREAVRLRPNLPQLHVYFLKASPWLALFGALWLLTAELNPRLKRQELVNHSTLLRPADRFDTELYDFLSHETPKDAVLLTPPAHEGLRYHSRRAIIADWKSVPIVPKEILEWRQRLSDVSGRMVNGYRDLYGYDSLDARRLSQLKQKYRIDYAVTLRGRPDTGGKVVFTNARWVVRDVR